MNIGILTRHEISLKKQLEIAFSKKNCKSYLEIEVIVGCSKSAAFLVYSTFFKSRTVKIYEGLADQRNSQKYLKVPRLR